MTGIYIRFAADSLTIEKCSDQSFDGANGFAFRFPDADAPVDPDPVEVGARAASKAMGFDFDEQCGYETEADHCREMMRHITRAVLAGAA